MAAMYEDDEPELTGYEPHEKPLRSAHLVTAMRVMVVLGLVALVLPGILITASTASRTAVQACGAYTAYYASRSVDSSARFELFGAEPGWNCYAIGFDGTEVLVRTMGLIPTGARVPQEPLQNS